VTAPTTIAICFGEFRPCAQPASRDVARKLNPEPVNDIRTEYRRSIAELREKQEL
jgi:hypothetical protein